MASSARSQEPAVVTIQVAWDDRTKRWEVTGRFGHVLVTMHTEESNISMDRQVLRHVVLAVTDELEQRRLF